MCEITVLFNRNLQKRPLVSRQGNILAAAAMHVHEVNSFRCPDRIGWEYCNMECLDSQHFLDSFKSPQLLFDYIFYKVVWIKYFHHYLDMKTCQWLIAIISVLPAITSQILKITEMGILWNNEALQIPNVCILSILWEINKR